MAQSFVRQGVNIVCSNMTISSPRILCLDPKKESVETQGITLYSTIPEPLLNILDKKLDACFKCKMPKKLWGGLAAFFAGIAIAAVVIAVLIAAPVAIPAIITAGAVTVKAALITAAVATVAAATSTVYTVYSVAHACDVCLDGDWEQYHQTVLIEGKAALLNKSRLMCPTGGTLNIIIDDELALLAAQLISSANNAEVWIHWGSKAFAGVVTFLFSGVLGTAIASAIEFFNTTVIDDRKSNQDSSLLMTVGVPALEYPASAGIQTATEGAVKRAAGSASPVFTREAFGKNLLNKASIIGAIISFAVDVVSNQIESSYEYDAKIASEDKNNEDEENGNNIGIIAITQ